MIPVEIITTVISTLAGFIIGFINNKINHKKDIQKQLLINVYAPLKYIFDTSQFSKKYIDTIKMDILNIVKSNNQFVSEDVYKRQCLDSQSRALDLSTNLTATPSLPCLTS